MYNITRNGSTVVVDAPNFVKLDSRFNSFKVCGFEDAECILIQDGDQEAQYWNINVQRYPQYGLCTCVKIR